MMNNNSDMESKIHHISFPEKRIDYFLLFIAISLVLLGLFVVFSSSAYVAEVSYNGSTFFFRKQLIYACIGFFAMGVGLRMDFYHLRSLIKPGMLFVTTCLLFTYIPFLGGTTINGANGWLRIPVINFGFQPSELAKVILIIFSANLLANPEYQKLNLKEKFITILPIISMIGIVVLQPDIGNTSIISMAVFSIYFAAGLSFKKIFAAGIVMISAVAILIKSNPYQMARITGFMNPWEDPQGKGFQLIQSLMAIGSGGFSGKGLGQSMQKLFYLPESHTDFIFSVFCEEGGLIGALFLILLVCLLAIRGFTIALKTKDLFVKLLTIGITSLICGQSLMNMGVATGILPTTGITLPFISYGGTSLIVNLFCIGLLLNASKYTEAAVNIEENNYLSMNGTNVNE